VVDTYRGLKRVDAYWDRLLLGCEIDGDRWHSSKEARERDRGRRNAIQGERVKLFDFSVAEVMRSPRTVLEDTEANLLARARELRVRAWWL
jgi:very-short-patch-repair endonuclease